MDCSNQVVRLLGITPYITGTWVSLGFTCVGFVCVHVYVGHVCVWYVFTPAHVYTRVWKPEAALSTLFIKAGMLS